MELELDSSNSNYPLKEGHSLTKSELDSSITSAELDSHSHPSSDHHNHNHNHHDDDDDDQKSSDSINDQLNSLAIDDGKVVAENNGGEDGGCEEERENNEVEIGEIENGVEIEDVKNEELSKNEEEEEEENKNEEELSEKEKEKESSNRNNNKRREYSRFPVREDAEDCAFYMKTGVCKFGMNCKFNHPPNHKKFQGAKVKVKEEGVDSGAMKEKDETVDKEQVECKYFDRPGGCKFGKACKYNHIKKANPSKLNFMGLPIRPGEKECPFYMRNGSCKYGANCRFNHPDPTTIGVADALPRYSNGGPVFSPNVSQSTLVPWSPTTLNESLPCVPLMFSPTQGVPPPPPEWNAYQAPLYTPERNVHMPPTYAVNGLLERPEQMQGAEFPERPGQPECSYFLKTGNCKYKSACKFHHPKSVMAQSPSCRLSDMGLPLRPGENVCSHYSRYGICKYGPACKYDHPINYAHSSELTISTVDQTSALGSMVNNQTMAAGS